MKFICFKDWAQLPQGSNDLYAQAEQASLFFSRQWFENLIATALEDDQSLLLACVVDENDSGRLATMLPLLTLENKEWTALSHSYSSLFSFFLAENNQQEILNCLCQGLKQLPFDYLTLKPIAEDDCSINRLQQAMEASGLTCYRHFSFYNWFHRTNGQSFADYMAERPSRVRNTVARKQRKLEREHGFEIRLFINDNLEQALADYHALYQVSWKANEQHEGIVQGLTQRFAKQCWPRLAILYIEGKPAAAQLWFVVQQKASIFRLVYDETWKRYSTGSILMAYLMEYVIDTDKVEEIDFLMGNDRYKQDWMSERRERWALTCVNKSRTEQKVNLLIRATRHLKQRLKKLT